MNSLFRLDGLRCLVTGGASGIGQAIAVAFAEAGAEVAITSNRQSPRPTQEAIEAHGGRCLAFQVDLSAAAEVQGLTSQVQSAFGAVDVLVNNAGIIRRANASEHSASDWDAVMAVNLDTVWHLAQQFGAGMLERGHGRIINIASLLSFQGGIRVPAYTASKHAVLGLTRALCNEWADKGVTVNAIAPGYIETGNTAALRADTQRSRQILERIPAGRWGQAKDIGGAAVFLASGSAAYVNGQILAVDGGWMAR